MLLSAICGAVIAMIPCLVFCTVSTQARELAVLEMEEAKSELEEREQLWIYVLAREMQAGEEITEEDLRACEILSAEPSLRVITNKNEIVGKRVKCALGKDTVLEAEMLYEGDVITDDLREVRITEAELPKDLKKGDYLDVRIFFPDGEDFVVLSRKSVVDVTLDEAENPISAVLVVNEEELLLLASAYVDSTRIRGAKTYALRYVSEMQPPAIVNYPVSVEVMTLLAKDPNARATVLSPKTQEMREALERHLGSTDDRENSDGEVEIDQEELMELFR